MYLSDAVWAHESDGAFNLIAFNLIICYVTPETYSNV